MKRFSIFILSSFLIMAIISCSAKERAYKISVTNTLDIQRSQETIEIFLKDVAIFSIEDYNNLTVVNSNGQELLHQLIDVDQNSEADHIIFQSDFAPKQTQEF